MIKHKFPPAYVLRPMLHGHFGVLRYITIFRKNDEKEVETVKKMNEEVMLALLEHDFIPYKTPGWAVEKLRDRIDGGFIRLLKRIKNLLDPQGIMNPEKWAL